MANESEPTLPGQPSTEAFEALGEMVVDIQDLMGGWQDTKPLPQTLYHFTDCAGLIGILQTQALWASLSTSLNDASEGMYAPMQLGDALREQVIIPKTLDPQAILAHCDPARLPQNVRVFVSSFCGAREAAHWLHYGRAGTGVAVGFDSHALYRVGPFSLFQVRYRQDEQRDLLRALMTLVDRYAARFATDPAALNLFAEAAVSMARVVAPWMKHPAFASEDEWRLVGGRMITPSELAPILNLVPELASGQIEEKTKFRTVNDRIVPYVPIPLPVDSVRHIELGAACPILPAEQSLRVLIEDCVGREILITRSDVSVRP